MTIGERIKEKRIEMGMTQEELAKKAGYKSRSSINKIEVSRDLPLDKVEQVARLLDCSPSYLMGWEEEFTVASAKIDAQLTMADGETKEYMLKFANLPTEKKKHIMDLIDMFE